MFQKIRVLIASLKLDPLPTVCALLIATVVYLWLDSLTLRQSLIEVKGLHGNEIVAANEKCSERIELMRTRFQNRLDSISANELERANEQLKQLNEIISTLKKRRK